MCNGDYQSDLKVSVRGYLNVMVGHFNYFTFVDLQNGTIHFFTSPFVSERRDRFQRDNVFSRSELSMRQNVH